MLKQLEMAFDELSDDEVIGAILDVPTHFVDLVITATSVLFVSGSKDNSKLAGEAITAGQPVYVDATLGTLFKTDANATGKKTAYGVALNGGGTGQPIVVAYGTGTIVTIGATVAVGTIYVVSGNAGGIAPAADLVSGWDCDIIGVATTAANITLVMFNSGAAVP